MIIRDFEEYPNFNYIGISCVNIKENIFCYYCLFANKKNK